MAGKLPGEPAISRHLISDRHSMISLVLTSRTIDPKTRVFYRKHCGKPWGKQCQFAHTAGTLMSSRIPVCSGVIDAMFSSKEKFHQRNIGDQRFPGGICRRLRLHTSVASANGSHEQDGNSKTASSEGSDDNRGKNSQTAPKNGNSGINETSSNNKSSTSSPPQEKQSRRWWANRKWNWKETVANQAREIVTLFLQFGVVLFLMRFLRPSIPLPGSEARVSTSYVNVPFSEFLNRINSNHVQKVEVDGVHFTFRLKPEVASPSENVVVVDRTAAPGKRILYTTIRPSDMKIPYEKMLENEVEFGAPDKRSGGFLNSAMVALLYIALVAGLLNRVPLKFSQRSTGPLRNRKARGSGNSKSGDHGDPIMFTDVAGVDEAKEELQEIVEFLRNPDRYTRLGARPPRGVLLGQVLDLVQREVKSLLQSALAMALLVIRSNPTVLEGLGAQLEVNEKVEGEVLQEWLKLVVAPLELAAFIKGDCMVLEKAEDMFSEKAEYTLPEKSV